jgi:iron-sulfur cluster assembly protein
MCLCIIFINIWFLGVTVLVDPKALLTVLGSEMDYVEDNLSSQFVFHNPNVKGTCGCGESFTV